MGGAFVRVSLCTQTRKTGLRFNLKVKKSKHIIHATCGPTFPNFTWLSNTSELLELNDVTTKLCFHNKTERRVGVGGP